MSFNTRLSARLAQEADYLSRVYHQKVEFGFDPSLAVWWVHLPQLPLPRGWRQRSTPLLITVKEGYPMSPPDGFMLRMGLVDEQGRTPGHYFGSHMGRGMDGWAWFCLHPTGWSGDFDFRDGDSIVKYLHLIEIALAKVVS